MNIPLKYLWLVLCLLGAVLPMSAFLPWVAAHGLDLPLMVTELFSTRIGAFFGLDVIIAALALLLLIYRERRSLPAWGAGAAAAATLLAGVSLGLPLFLYLRETARGR